MAVAAGPRAAPARPAGRRLRRRRRAARPTGSRCRPASSTSAARRRPATSAPRRCCSPSSPAMYAVYHGPDGPARRSRARVAPATRPRWPPALRDGGVDVVHEHVLRHRDRCGCPGGAAEVVAAARERGRQPAARRRRHVGVACDETTDARARSAAVLERVRRRPATSTRSTRRPATRCPTALLRDRRRSSPTRSSTRTTPRPRCCATCAGSPTGPRARPRR